MNLHVTKLNTTATLPQAATHGAAGLDLCACIPLGHVSIAPDASAMIGTGIAVAIPEGHVGLMFSRSGLGKHGVRLANCVGVIDSDYRGELISNMHNDSDHTREVTHGMRFVQLVIVPCPQITVVPVDALENTVRGKRGFGSTGV